MFPSCQSLFVIVLSPLFAHLWLRLHHSRWNVSTVTKFALGLLLAGASLAVLAFGTHTADSRGLVTMWWVVLSYFLMACGELALSPVGLSSVTALAPPKLVGMVMGVWFLCLAAGYAVAGQIANLTSVPANLLNNTLATKLLYGHKFAYFSITCFIAGAILLLLTPTLRRAIKE